ncbi:hypothetical protein [Bradyrhizobium tunisiense]|uniref:hypothetical protein n=1 Tax=Bradyrhizobium tunisiense TaxID=3278709 RepID=UPI0035DF6D4C
MASFTQLPSVNWRVQVRRKNRYVSETFRRRKDGEDRALDMERSTQWIPKSRALPSKLPGSGGVEHR